MDKNLVVEVSWEACLQLGGIYTVLRSKAPVAVRRLGPRYCLVGPYNQTTAAVEFEPLKRTGPFGRACEILERQGIHAHYGRWLITGKPQVVLIDFMRSFDRLAEFKYYLWKDHFIETRDEQEVNDVVLFGSLVAEYFKALVEAVRQGDQDTYEETAPLTPAIELPIVAHFHEWMAGVPIPILRRSGLPITTVFTTHATILGRYLAADDPNFYYFLPKIDPHGAAAARGIYPRFAIERAAAHGATVFTTVSDVTGMEAEYLLGRKPDLILPNGLNIQRFAALHEFQNLHAYYKKRIHEFVMGHFFPSYSFDLDRTLYIFTSGRYEFRNKGMDLFIESLARLNWRLRSANTGVTVVAFIITKGATRGLNVEALKSQVLLGELRSTIGQISAEMGEKLLLSVTHGKLPQIDDLMDEYAQVRLKRTTHAWRRQSVPAIVTHDLVDDAGDPVMAHLRNCGLLNGPDDPVKVVFHPEFMTSTNPLLQLDYDQFVRGSHLGVFPSYYEPWGYTPMECVALGVPAITSDLAGFGSFVRAHVPDHEAKGLFAIDRRYRSFDESANHLTDCMLRVLTLSRRDRIDLRNRVESVSTLFDWQELARYYWDAHRIALERAAAEDSAVSPVSR